MKKLRWKVGWSRFVPEAAEAKYKNDGGGDDGSAKFITIDFSLPAHGWGQEVLSANVTVSRNGSSFLELSWMVRDFIGQRPEKEIQLKRCRVSSDRVQRVVKKFWLLLVIRMLKFLNHYRDQWWFMILWFCSAAASHEKSLTGSKSVLFTVISEV